MSILKPSTWNMLLPWGYLLIFSPDAVEYMDFTKDGKVTPYKRVAGILYKKVK